MTRPAAVLCALVLALTAACGGDDEGSAPTRSPSTSTSETTTGSSQQSQTPTPTDTTVLAAKVAGIVATDLTVPWAIAFLPDGSALVTERDTARIKRVSPDGDVTRVGTVDGVRHGGEGGLLGIALSPSYESDHVLYAYFTASNDNRIARIAYDGKGLADQRTIFDGIPAGPIHNGGRIAFGPDGMLYVGTGEAGLRDPAQDRGSLGGKILRITADGKPAPDNPFPGSPVYSLGHRNVQGLAWDASGQLWASEFGQNTWDELNRIKAGGNYGWPDVEGITKDKRFINPVREWHTDEASPSGIAVAGNAVYMSGLRGARLWQIPIPGGKAGPPKALLTGKYGRLRAVNVAPDGSLWVSTSNRDGRGNPRQGDDRIIRLTLS
jgi:glucose/arabinose dehydrogenase